MNEDNDYIVPHPRYGDKPRPSDFVEAIAAAREQWKGKTFRGWVFPESAIPADVSKQNYTVVSPRGCYVDMKRTCRDCGRFFIFFAEEQRHWYEELRFYIWAECVRCPECRRDEQILHHRFARYSANVNRDDLAEDLLATLVEDAIFLWEQALLKNTEVLYRLRKRAHARIPNRAAREHIDKLIASMDRDARSK